MYDIQDIPLRRMEAHLKMLSIIFHHKISQWIYSMNKITMENKGLEMSWWDSSHYTI
jgi:hypothetical protein